MQGMIAADPVGIVIGFQAERGIDRQPQTDIVGHFGGGIKGGNHGIFAAVITIAAQAAE